MVEKSKAQAGLAKGVQPKATGGILKKVAKSLDNVPEYEQAQLQRHDSSLNSTGTPEKSQSSEEEEKFKILCGGVQNSLALFQVSMAELLALKDELLKHALPPSLLLKVTLVTSKLFRGASDLAIPVNELVRLVNLYSAPWESKSAALKKLHEDYESKQRQLNVALQRLVIIGIQSERMDQERRVLNWERLFTRIMTSKAHGYRWKFLIDSFKKKIKTGEVYEAGTSTDEDVKKENIRKDRRMEQIRRKTQLKDTAVKRIMRESSTIEDAKSSITTSVKSKEFRDASSGDEVSSDSESIFNEVNSRQTSAEQSSRRRKMSPQPTLSTKQERSRSKISFSFEPQADSDDDDDDGRSAKSSLFEFKPEKQPVKNVRSKIQFADEKRKAKPKTKFRGTRFVDLSDEEEDKEEQKQKDTVVIPEPPKVVTEDKECWTQEPDCERFLHVRIYRPVCKKAESPCCSVVFLGHALKTSAYEPPPSPTPQETTDASENKAGSKADLKVKSNTSLVTSSTGSSNATLGSAIEMNTSSDTTLDVSFPQEEPPRFEELLFKLPDDNGYSPGDKRIDLNQEQLKVAVHCSRDQPMVAMSAIKYGDLKVLDHFEGRWSHTDYAHHIHDFPLISTLSDRDMPFGSDCGHVPLVCYMSKIESPKTVTKETETPSFEELVRHEIEERRKAEEEEREEAMRGISPPCYTESEMQTIRDSHTEEVQALHEEYERRMNELTRGLDAHSGNEEEMREFVHAATSPLFVRSPSPLRSHSSIDLQRTPRPPSKASRAKTSLKARPKISSLPAWGKDLPQDFMVRLDMFNENSEKYRLDLEEKTKRTIKQKFELQMAVQNRLSIPEEGESPQEDVCLPAVFMPTRTGLVFSPKAHSYFHPPGSSVGRLTQPPSVFKLPNLGSADQVSVLNLFDMGQRFVSSIAQQDNTNRIHRVPQTAPPPPTACDLNSPQPHPGRSYTR